MKYLADPFLGYRAVAEDSDEYIALSAVHVERRPVFLEAANPLVVAFLAAKPTQKSIDTKKVDADVDAIYLAAIGNRATEYSEAEAQAAAYKTALYAGTVPAYVQSWLTSNLKSLTTAQQAADDILTQAAAWRGAAAAIRANRFIAKKNINNDVSTAMAQWNGFVAAIRGQLGL